MKIRFCFAVVSETLLQNSISGKVTMIYSESIFFQCQGDDEN